jgi:acyl-coenzyme A thioesterase PaaI-like protein
VTKPATSDQLRRPDPFVEFAGSTVVEADAKHAVAEQRPVPELDNHAGVRHAGALFAVGYAASRALVAAALEPITEPLTTSMVDSEIAYERVVAGELVTATAEPSGDDWGSLLGRVSEGETVQLPTSVTLRNENQKTVTAMSVCWQVAPDAQGEPR